MFSLENRHDFCSGRRIKISSLGGARHSGRVRPRAEAARKSAVRIERHRRAGRPGEANHVETPGTGASGCKEARRRHGRSALAGIHPPRFAGASRPGRGRPAPSGDRRREGAQHMKKGGSEFPRYPQSVSSGRDQSVNLVREVDLLDLHAGDHDTARVRGTANRADRAGAQDVKARTPASHVESSSRLRHTV